MSNHHIYNIIPIFIVSGIWGATDHHSSTWFIYLFFFIMGLNFVDPSNESIILLFLLVLLLKQRQKQKAAECAMVFVTTSVLLERKSNRQNRENDHTNMTAPFPSAQQAWYYGWGPRWNPSSLFSSFLLLFFHLFYFGGGNLCPSLSIYPQPLGPAVYKQ